MLDKMFLNTRKCKKCKSCKCNNEESVQLTCQEQFEQDLCDSCVTVKDGVTTVTFPFVESPEILKDNKEEMLRRSKRLWENLKKKDLLSTYNQQFKDFEERGVLVKVSDEEIKTWPGVKNYISHHAVIQPNKPSTPVRLVSNSSQQNNGSSLNQCCAKGPNQLSNLLKLIIKFRNYKHAYGFDIKKCYHTLITCQVEKFLRLLIWKQKEE